MGLTTLEMEVGNPVNPQTTERVEVFGDSGAIYSVVGPGAAARGMLGKFPGSKQIPRR
jgi:hypothetical protein